MGLKSMLGKVVTPRQVACIVVGNHDNHLDRQSLGGGDDAEYQQQREPRRSDNVGCHPAEGEKRETKAHHAKAEPTLPWKRSQKIQ